MKEEKEKVEDARRQPRFQEPSREAGVSAEATSGERKREKTTETTAAAGERKLRNASHDRQPSESDLHRRAYTRSLARRERDREKERER